MPLPPPNKPPSETARGWGLVRREGRKLARASKNAGTPQQVLELHRVFVLESQSRRRAVQEAGGSGRQLHQGPESFDELLALYYPAASRAQVVEMVRVATAEMESRQRKECEALLQQEQSTLLACFAGTMEGGVSGIDLHELRLAAEASTAADNAEEAMLWCKELRRRQKSSGGVVGLEELPEVFLECKLLPHLQDIIRAGVERRRLKKLSNMAIWRIVPRSGDNFSPPLERLAMAHRPSLADVKPDSSQIEMVQRFRKGINTLGLQTRSFPGYSPSPSPPRLARLKTRSSIWQPATWI